MHPIHVHLVQFQLLNRQLFDSNNYTVALKNANPVLVPGDGIPNPVDVTPYLLGEPVYPTNTNEYGWKDVIQALPNQVTRIIIRFSPQEHGTKFPFDPTIGSYVWHCHLISHEDNDMMRPLQLVPLAEYISIGTE